MKFTKGIHCLGNALLVGLLTFFIGAGQAFAVIVDLSFSGTYTGSPPVFGEALPADFEYRMRYDTDLDTNTVAYEIGERIGLFTAVNAFHGYSRDGIISSEFTFGTKSFEVANIVPQTLPTGEEADFFLDFDLASGGEASLVVLQLGNFPGDLLVLGGRGVGGPFIELGGGSFIRDQVGTSAGNTLLLEINQAVVATVPEPSTIGLFGLGLLGLGFARRAQKKV